MMLAAPFKLGPNLQVQRQVECCFERIKVKLGSLMLLRDGCYCWQLNVYLLPVSFLCSG